MSDMYLPINLPSQGRTYNVPAESISIRPYNGEDEMLLAQINPVNLERNFLTVLKRVVQGIDPKQLTLGDRLYIIIWEYINSYSETIRVKDIVCSHCLKKSDFVVDLRKLDVVSLSEGIPVIQDVELPISKQMVKLRILTVGDEVEVEKFQENNPADAYFYRWARSIVGDKDVVTLIQEMKKWPAKDLARVRMFQEDMDHGPKTSILTACPKCGEEEEVAVPFRLELFYPYGEDLRNCFKS